MRQEKERTKPKSDETNIVQLNIPLTDINPKNIGLVSAANLNQQTFSSNTRMTLPELIAAIPKTIERSQQRAVQHTTLDIRHPLLEFITDCESSLREISDTYMRPAPKLGITEANRKDFEIGNLLKSLESSEKKFWLISNSKPSLDSLSTASRRIAHEAEFLIRGFRRNLIVSSSDPTHPGEQKLPFVLEGIDSLQQRLHELKLSFEDFAAAVFLNANAERLE